MAYALTRAIGHGYFVEHNLTPHLENDFQLDGGTEWKACNAIHQTARTLVFSENVLQQFRSAVSDFRLFADISRSGHRHAEPDDPRDFVERSQMLPCDRKDVERCEVSCPAPCFHIELRSDAPNEFCHASFCGKHTAKKKQVARLYRLYIGAERLRRRRELDAEFFQPLFGPAGREPPRLAIWSFEFVFIYLSPIELRGRETRG